MNCHEIHLVGLNCHPKNYLGVLTPSDERNADFGNLSSKIKSVCIRLDQWLNITTQSVGQGVPTKIMGTRNLIHDLKIVAIQKSNFIKSGFYRENELPRDSSRGFKFAAPSTLWEF
jgi:hypothetical protein